LFSVEHDNRFRRFCQVLESITCFVLTEFRETLPDHSTVGFRELD